MQVMQPSSLKVGGANTQPRFRENPYETAEHLSNKEKVGGLHNASFGKLQNSAGIKLSSAKIMIGGKRRSIGNQYHTDKQQNGLI